MENDFSRGDVAFARDGFAERAQNGQRVRVRSPIGTPHHLGVGDVLAEKGSQVGAIVFEFGLHTGLGAVGASLQGVRRADGHVEGCVGVAQGRGEDVNGPQVRARDEARHLHLRGVVGRVDERGHGIATARGLAQGAAGGVRRARVQNATVAGGTSDGFRGPSTAQAEADRVNVLIGIQGRAMARVEPPSTLGERPPARSVADG